MVLQRKGALHTMPVLPCIEVELGFTFFLLGKGRGVKVSMFGRGGDRVIPPSFKSCEGASFSPQQIFEMQCRQFHGAGLSAGVILTQLQHGLLSFSDHYHIGTVIQKVLLRDDGTSGPPEDNFSI
jgi:hypothetical protein